METIDEEVTAKALDFMEQRQEGRQAVLRLVELHPHARLHAPEDGVGGQDRPRHLCRRHGRARRPWSARCSPSSRNWASRTTPSSCTPPTTARSPSPGPTAAPRCSAARRTRNWEGGYRVPTLIRWPGVIKPGTVINDIGAHEDMLPTLLAAAGDTTRQGRPAEGQESRRHDLQGPPRRLQPAARAQGRGRMAAQGVHLLDRRRQRRRAALRQLEGHLPAAERPRPEGLAGALRGTARARC